MSQRRTPPKQRHRERPRHHCAETNQPNDDPRGYSAPSHLAGHFEQHDHGSGHGPFGFTQHVLP